jgi:hypothetical protein
MEADLRYPIGKFRPPENFTDENRRQFIHSIAETPERLVSAIAGLNAGQLDTPYRPGGWTIRQLVHHVPDSHMNAYIRFKLALTEDEPTIKPYEENLWAGLADTKDAPISTSITLLESLHARWVVLLCALTPAEWNRKFRHPDLGPVTLDHALALYAWHGKHHVAHITSLRQRSGWL